MAGPTVAIGLVICLIVHILDQATDVFAATLFYFEGHYWGAALTFGFVMLPGVCVAISEIKHFCSRDVSSLLKAITYLLLTPVWSLVIYLYSFCDHRYVETALLFKTLEGFVEAGPQLALQLSLLFHGSTSESNKLILEKHVGHYFKGMDNDSMDYETTTTSQDYYIYENDYMKSFDENMTQDMSLQIFGRNYDQSAREWFGWVHLSSVFMSFISIFSTTIMFNELQPRSHGTSGVDVGQIMRCDSKTCGKLSFGLPFFFATLIFRSLAISLLIIYLKMWAGVVCFGLFFFNFLTSLYIGDNFHRSTTYAAWSLLVPAGFSTDPAAFLGYTKLPLEPKSNAMNPPTEKETKRSQTRVKYFLTMHVLTSIFVLGSSLTVMYTLIYSYPDHYFHLSIIPSEILSTLILPILLLSLGFSILLARPYHRIDCSGGEVPAGNIIV